MRVRPATPLDALALATVEVDSWRWAYPGLLPQPYLDALSIERRAHGMRMQLAQTQSRTMVWAALDGVRFCGVASAGASRPEEPDVGELHSLYVSAQSVGTGVGALLLAYVTAQLRTMHYGRAMLWVLERNERARGFYERHGWSDDGKKRREPMGGFSVDVVRYSLALR